MATSSRLSAKPATSSKPSRSHPPRGSGCFLFIYVIAPGSWARSGSWLTALAEACQDTHTTLPLRALVASGEALPGPEIERLQNIFGVPVRSGYGMTEVGTIAFECPAGRKHINEEWVYVEVTDRAGTPFPSGKEGWVVVTSFYNKVMPIIRYNTGDLGILSDVPCPCGRTLRTIKIQGRQAQLITLPGNKVVSVTQLSVLLSLFPQAIRRYQLVWNGGYSFTVRVVPGADFAHQQSEVEQTLCTILHPTAQIEWEKIEHIPHHPSGKAIYFVDNSKNTRE